jgi:hypothetical protein
MNTDRLRKFLGNDYESVIRYTIIDAFADSFASQVPTSAAVQPSNADEPPSATH